MSPSPFLTADWKDLVLANYCIDPAILKPYMPAGAELDFFNDRCYVSLVGFLFRKVRVKGFSIPFHTFFPK